MQTQKPIVRMEDWAVVSSVTSGGYQELKPGSRLLGKVFGHPRISDGDVVFSSPILTFDPSGGVVETRNTAYLLGAPNAAYDEQVRLSNRKQGTEVAA